MNKVTGVDEDRIKLVVSGFNGMVRQVEENDTIKRLVNEKHLSEAAEERQLFAIEYDKKELEEKDKTFLVFKFLDRFGKATTFKRLLPFVMNGDLKGRDILNRLCRLMEKIWKIWKPVMDYKQLRKEV